MKKRTISLIYLVLGTLGAMGYLNIFEHWFYEFVLLSLTGIIFYLISLLFFIWIHPFICLYYWRRYVVKKQSTKIVKIHFIWSMLVAISFWVMILNGYMITV
ncbi:MAG: Unknown protein [uncultured Sulfurovum sp.]|uniref:Uncharacterized protein n=1 Tax=uncultured Sulfurovum sp. TaxID=269237 RepID=A0A6S6RRS4_9BACT|nr:MAG: Unknown protein [uncultured Sulfurovum sp.]